MFRVIFTKAAQNFKFPMHTTPSQCPIFRTSPSPFYTSKPEPGFQLCSAHGLGGSCIANEEKCSSEVAFLLLLLLCTVLIGATDLLFTIFPVCKSTLDSQKFFCWPSGSHFLKEFSIQMTPSFPEKKNSLFILMSLGAQTLENVFWRFSVLMYAVPSFIKSKAETQEVV